MNRILDWRGWNPGRSPRFFARLGPFVLKVWPQAYRKLIHFRNGPRLFGVDLGRLEFEVWKPIKARF